MAEQWFRFVDLLTHNIYFRSGFFSALLAVGICFLIWRVFYGLYVHWLKIRQFFEPIKKPGKAPVETGPSPAGMLFGCMGRLLLILLVVTLFFGGVIFFANQPSG